MKNLNVNLAENFRVELQDAQKDDGDLSEGKFEELITYSEDFLTELAKDGVFPENTDIIGADFLLNIYKEAFDYIDLQHNEANIIYGFNADQELEYLRIVGAYCY